MLKLFKPLLKNIVIVVIAFAGIAIVFASLFSSPAQTKDITLTELANKINAQEVTHITVEENTVTATFKDNSQGVTKKETESGLSETLKNYGVDPKTLQQIPLEVKDPSGFSYWLGVLLPTLLPVILIGLFFWFTFRQARAGASQAMSFGKSNLKLFSPFKDRVTFADVAGSNEAKQELVEVVDFLKNPKKYIDIGAKIPRGVLLMGVPGTGKTLLARAVAGEAGVPFFHISASEFVEMFVGVGASRTRDAFLTAKKAAPSILFIDEIDAIGRERGAGLGGGHDEREQTLNQILVEMDGFEKEAQVIVLAATNRPDILDPALLRPGRFDRRVTLDLPDINDREAILRIHGKNKPLAKDVDYRKIAVRTPGFSGADLANLMNEGAILAARENKTIIEQIHLYEAIEKVLLGPERKSRTLSEQEKKITAYHEAGHALVAASLKDADPVHKISIISRGQAGGYTLKLPTEDRYLRTRKQFLADLAMTLGGYSAEETIFKDISTGASNDLAVASEIARRMVTRYGMGKFGPITFGKTQELIFLGKEISTERNYSDKIASEIDGEVEHILSSAHKTAREMLRKYKDALDALAQKLIEKETIEKDEFEQLVEQFSIKPAVFSI
ncbi:MAG: ATP-dependent zinc metalloprotease FtsH [Patescibacteria group bacterium]|nr:ATP-dependent zinc metalloprotease FtsH [Patescibacteria group bacterium]